MKGFETKGESDVRHINKWLVDNVCITIPALALIMLERELLTFWPEPQLKGHIAANLRLGNDKRC